MKIEQGIDSLTILVQDSEHHYTELQKYYKINNLSQHYSTEIKEPDYFTYAFNEKIKPITIKSYWTTGKIEAYGPYKVTSTTYRVFEFIGLKSHNKKRDIKHQELLNNFLIMIKKSNDFIYRITRIDIYNDYYTNNKSIENFFAARINKIGLHKPLNKPFNYYKTTSFYIEDTNIKKPSLRTMIYDKSFKYYQTFNHKLENEHIMRLEISVRNIGTKINNNESLRDLIENYISYYRLFYFESIDDCNTIKTTYKNVMDKETQLSNKTLKKIKRFNGQEINLSITKETDFILSQLY